MSVTCILTTESHNFWENIQSPDTDEYKQCDACVASAHCQVLFTFGELSFCKHHWDTLPDTNEFNSSIVAVTFFFST